MLHVRPVLCRLAAAAAAAASICLSTAAPAADPKPGDTITADNASAYGAYLPPSLRIMLDYGMRMDVVAPSSCPWPRTFIEATERYASEITLGSDKRRLRGYVAGMPFPHIAADDPDAAWKIMWNHEHKPAYSDDVRTEWVVENQDDRGQLEKQLSSDVWRRLKWEGRIALEPRPVIEHDPPLRYTEQWGPLQSPFDLKGTSFLLYRYQDAERPDASWLYFPQLRRVRRYSTSDRSGTLFGTDFDQDSIWGFNSKPEWWDFRLLGEKEILVPMHAGKYGTSDIWCGSNGKAAWVPCVAWEVRKVWLIEGRPTLLAGYAFAKRHLWIDQEVYNVSTSEMFDQREELWKVWQNIFWCTKAARAGRAYPDKRLFTPGAAVIDFQLSHSSRAQAPADLDSAVHDWMFETGEESLNAPDYYTVANIIAEGR